MVIFANMLGTANFSTSLLYAAMDFNDTIVFTPSLLYSFTPPLNRGGREGSYSFTPSSPPTQGEPERVSTSSEY